MSYVVGFSQTDVLGLGAGKADTYLAIQILMHSLIPHWNPNMNINTKQSRITFEHSNFLFLDLIFCKTYLYVVYLYHSGF